MSISTKSACAAVGALVVLAGTVVAQQYVPRVPAVWPGGRVLVGGDVITPDAYIDPEPIDFAVTGPEGRARAVLEFPEADVTIVLSAVTADISVTEDGGVHVVVTDWSEPDGWLDVYHQAEEPPALVEANGSSLNLGRGVLRVTADNQIVTPELDANLADRIDADYRAIIRASLTPDLVRVAESVAEGDIEPPTQAAPIAAVAFAPAVQVREIVPRGGSVSRVVSTALSAGAATAPQSVAESFIGSGEAALAVVGARLQRTRVVGQAGGARAPLAVNPNLSTRFTLGRTR